MRRIFSSLLLALMCAGFALPLLQAQPSSLPACCRAAGKHRCAMAAKGDGYRAPVPACPYRHSAALVSPTTSLPVANAALGAECGSSSLLPLHDPPLSSSHFADCHKRGPPLV